MRILVVHQYFLGRNDAGGSRWNQFARYWAEAGVAERIDLRLGPAADAMHRLLDTRQGESFA